MDIKAEYPLLGLGHCDVNVCEATHCDTTNRLWRHFSRDGRKRTLCRLYIVQIGDTHFAMSALLLRFIISESVKVKIYTFIHVDVFAD